MKDKISKKRKKYAVALLAATAATVATSFSPSAPWVLASKTDSDPANPNLPPDFSVPVYNELDFDPDVGKIKVHYYNVQAGDNVAVTRNTFTEKDYDGNNVTYNNFIVKANDTLVEDSDDIVVDKGNSENPEKGTENGVTRKYKLKLSETLKNELKASVGGGGGAAPSKLADGTNTTVSGDGTDGNKYTVNIKPDLTGITSITGNTLTLNGGTTAVAIGNDGVNVGGKKITNIKEGDVSENSTDAVTGKQLHATNEKVEGKLDKTAERHIKPEAYTVNDGTVTLKYVDANGKVTDETATISGLNPVKSVASGDANTLTVDNNNGAITVTPVVATNVTDAGNANKLTTASVVNTAINNATNPLANKALSNITDDGKKVITGLSTEVVQGNGITVKSNEDATTGKKTYTISAAKLNFANGTNTTVDGDGTKDKPYKYNVNPALTGITSITGDTGLTFTGAGTAVTINAAGVNVGGAKVTNLADAALTNSSTDAVTGKQLHTTNEKVEGKLDKTAERHVKPQAYSVENGTVTLKYVDANGKETTETATINGLNPVKSVASGDESKLTVANNNGDITVTPVVATDITKADDANKLATAGVVNTAITNATNPLANKNLSNITDDGKKVITGLGTEVVQGDGVTVTPNEDATTGKKTYTISAAKLNFANGTNTTVDGDGTKDKPYKYNVNPALTGITSITGDTGLTFTGAGTAVTINAAGVNVGGAKVTNLADAALTNSSSDAVTGKQLHETNEKVEGKLDKTAERHIKPQSYSVENGTVTLKYVDANGKETTETATINGLNPVKSVASGDESKLTVANNNGDITVTPVVATDITKTDDANKLATAGVVNTAITNATSPLADKNLSNITDAGKKVITGLGTEVVQGNGVTVTSSEDAATGKKTYTISALKPKFAAGTNTTLEGDGTTTPYKYNVNPALTGMTSITGDTGLTFTGAGTAVTINAAGVNVGGAKVTNLADAALTNSSSDAVTGKQLHETNEKVEGKLDKTAERHIKPEAYTVNDGTVTLKYVDANGKVTDETATISGLNPVKSVASGDANTLTVDNNNGAITVTPVVATNVTDAGNANKLTTASVVNTAINNATNPLANKALSNITDDGKKVITGLSTEVVQGNGITVKSNEDATTGKKTYTISANAVQPNFANGTNTTVEGDGTVGSPYKYNVNPALTGITSITNATTADGDGTKLTIDGDKLSVVNKKGADTTTVTIGKDGIDAGGKTITNVADPTGNKDAANKEYVDAQKWGLKVQNGDAAAEAVTPKDKAITLKASADASADETTPKKGLLITKDDQGNITVGLDKATRTALDNAVNGSQLLNERVTSPVIFVDKDGKQVFKTADGKFTTKDGAEITNADDLAKIHTKVNAAKSMTLDNVASALGEPAQDADYLAKLKEAKEGNTVNNSAVNVTDLHNTANAIVEKGLKFKGNLGEVITKKLGEELDIVGEGTVAETVATAANNIRTKNVDGKLEIGLVQDLTGITSITGGVANNDTKIELGKTGLKVTNTVTPDAGGAVETKTITIGKDGIDASNTKIINVADPTGNKDAANKAYVDAQKWGLKVQNGTDAAADVTPNTGKITLKTGTDTSDDATKPKKGLVIAKDDQGNITLGLEKADRTTLDNAANLGNTASDGRDGQAGKNATGVIAGSAGAQGPTGKDGLNGKDLTNKVNALRNGEAGTVVYTNAAGDRLVKANDGKYYKADEVEPNGEKKPGATAVDTKDVIASLVSPDGNTTGATNKLSNIADGAISKDSKDAVNGSQLFNERVTSPVIFVDKDGNQVFKTAEGKFVTKEGTAVADADLDKVHTKVNAEKAMTLDNVASAVTNLTGTTYLDKLAEGAKADNKVANSAVNVTDLHAATTAILDKPITFIGDNDTNDKIERKLGETLKIHGVNNITVTKDATNADTLNVALKPTLTGITSITNATTEDGDGTKLTIDGDKLSVVNKKGADTTTVTIGKDGIDAGGKTITNVVDPTGNKDAANKAYVDAQKWGLKVQNGTDAAADVTPNTGKITLKTGTDTSDDATKPKKGLVIAKDDQGNITLGLEKADRTTLDNAANLGNTASDGRDGQAGKNATGVIAGSAGAQGPTGKDGLNGKDLTNKVNALRNGEAGTVVYTNAAGDRLVKANDGKYYKADEVEPNGEKKPGATAVDTKDVIASLVSPDGNTTGATNKLSNIADGAISKDSKDAVNGSQLFNERVTSPVIFVDKDGNQVFKTAEGKFVTKEGTAVADADLDKVHTKVNADKAMTLDNVASAVTNLTGNTYLDKLAEGAKQDNKVANSAVNVTDLHAATTAILDKPITFIGDNDTNDKIDRKLGETLKIHGVNNITVTKDAANADTLNVALKPTLTGITSITNATTADGDGTKLTIDGDKLSVVNKKGADTTTVTIGKDGIDAGGKTITNVADPTGNKDAANKEYVDAQKWGLKVQNGTDAAADVTPNTGKITLKTGTDTSDDATKPKKGLVIAKDDQGNITLGLEKADRTTLDNAVNIGNTASDGRDGQAGANGQGVEVAGTAGAQGPTGKDGLNGKDLTSKVNALRNGEAGTVVYTNAAGDRLVKANDGKYYKADEVEPNGEKKPGATAVDTKDVIASLVSPDGKTTGATNKLSNIADGTVSSTSKDAVNGSQLFNERVTSPVIFVDKDGNQVFKTADGKFTTKDGAEITNADDLAKIHTKVNAAKSMTLDNVASALGEPAQDADYLAKLKEAKEGNTVNNSAVNVTDLHNTANAIVEKGLKFKGNLGEVITKKLGEELDIVGEGTVAETVATAANNIRTKNVGGKLEIGLVKDLKNITSITNAAPVDPTQPDAAKVASTTLTINGDALTVENKQADGKTATVTIGKDGIDAGGKTITNVADPTGNKDAANKEYVDAQKWGLKVQNGTDAAADVTPNTGKITLKTGTDTSDDATKPKKGLVIAKDDQGNITLGLEKADRTTLDNAVNLGNTGSDGRDGQAGKNATGVIAGSAGAQGPTGKDGLNGKDLTNKVNALRNGEAGTVVYTNAAGDRLVKANDGKYYKADEVEPNGEKKPGATAVDTKDVIASLVSPDGNTTGATNKLSNIADGAISKDSKDAVNGSQLFNERVTSPVIFVDKDGNQVFKTAEGKFVTKEGTAVADADLDKVHTKVNADKAMTLDNVASAVNNLTGTTYLDKLAEGAKADNKVANSAVNVTDLHSTANALVTKGLDFKGNLGDAIHKNLGETLEIVGEGTVAADATTAANNIRTKKTDDGKLEIGLVKDLTGITSITGGDANNDTKIELGKTGLKVTNTVTPAAGGAPETKTITIGKDGINADGTKITNVATPTDKADAANKEYVDAQKWGLKVQNGTDAAADVTPNTGKITLKTGTDTSDDATKPKKGLVIAKDDQGNITLGLEKADRTTLDNAANLGNTGSDGRDGQAGKNATGVVAGAAGAQGPTGKDGLNGKDLTSKVNALRNGEAGTVVYTNEAGERVVKANDGKYYPAGKVNADGTKADDAVAVTPEARLVNPDGTTAGDGSKLSNIAPGTVSATSKDAVNGSQLFNERVTSPVIFVDKDGNQVFKNADGKFTTKDGAEITDADELAKIHTKVNAEKPMTLDNVASAIKDLTGNTYLDKLAEGAKTDSKVANSAVNVTDLHNTANALVTKGLDFQGNLGDAIHKDLGAKLDIVGEGTVAADATTAADNIRTKNVDGKLEIGIVKDLKNITSITNAATADGDGTKLTIDSDKLSVVNKKGTDKTTVTIGKDGINAGGTKITNVAEGAISKDSTDVVIGKQLAATNEKVSNLEETKLNKTDDVHVKAGTYKVDDKTGSVALPLVKGNADTATGKNVTISGIVTHAALSNTMDAYELHIAGDKDSKSKTTLKKGLAVRGAENFTPDAATKEKGINIQATATEGGVNIKLSDTLTKMKGITFTPAENSKEAVSLTSNGLDNGGHTITNVAAGRNDTDVVNVAQLKGIANVVGDVNNRVNRSSAQSAALAGLQTLQYDPLEPTQISAGVGYYKGSTALALGVGHYKNESTLFHVGASVNGHGDEVMANASVTWKFGSRATESAVKDTYRQGPISASYTLQDKVSALEAQNQIQSEKINAQNQVIEDLKAQLAEVLQYIKK